MIDLTSACAMPVNMPRFCDAVIVFHRRDNDLIHIKTFENTWMIALKDRPHYSKIIELYSQENLERIISRFEIETEEDKSYCLSLGFTADLIENLWDIQYWSVWEAETETSAPNILRNWAKPEVAKPEAPEPRHYHIEKAMIDNPRVVLRTSSVVVDGKVVFLSLCASNCRPYIVDRIRVTVTDKFMWSIEKEDMSKLVNGLKGKEIETSRLAWGVGSTIAESQEVCLDRANAAWKRVHTQRGLKEKKVFRNV